MNVTVQIRVHELTFFYRIIALTTYYRDEESARAYSDQQDKVLKILEPKLQLDRIRISLQVRLDKIVLIKTGCLDIHVVERNPLQSEASR